MNSIVYKSLILSNILQLEQFGKELDNWLHENFSNKEGLFIAHTLISTGMQIDCGDIDINSNVFQKNIALKIMQNLFLLQCLHHMLRDAKNA